MFQECTCVVMLHFCGYSILKPNKQISYYIHFMLLLQLISDMLIVLWYSVYGIWHSVYSIQYYRILHTVYWYVVYHILYTV